MFTQVTGILIGGALLSATRRIPGHFGYTLLFGSAIGCFGVGTALIGKVKGTQ
jgi:hypothetical protein